MGAIRILKGLVYRLYEDWCKLLRRFRLKEKAEDRKVEFKFLKNYFMEKALDLFYLEHDQTSKIPKMPLHPGPLPVTLTFVLPLDFNDSGGESMADNFRQLCLT